MTMVFGENSENDSFSILKILKNFFKIAKISNNRFSIKKILGNKILVSNTKEIDDLKKLNFFLKKSSLPILIINNLEVLFLNVSSPQKEIADAAKNLAPFGYLIANLDDAIVRQAVKNLDVNKITFGFNSEANFQITNYKASSLGTTFKLNFGGNILPIWLKNAFDKKNVYSIVVALCIGYALNLNLVKLTQALRNYEEA